MAIVSVKILGNTEVKSHDVETIAQLKAELGLADYKGSVNGDPQDDSFSLSSGDLVTFAESVKGGNK